MGMGFQFEQHRLRLRDLSWDLKKTISWEMGLGPPFTTLWTAFANILDFAFYNCLFEFMFCSFLLEINSVVMTTIDLFGISYNNNPP